MKAIESAIGEKIAPRLKAFGFARRRLVWNRRAGYRIQVIAIQQSANNTDLDSRFTVNLGQLFDPLRTTDWVRAVDCRPEPQRLGFLTPARDDVWYRCRPDDPADVGRAVAACLADLERYGLPWLDGPATPESPDTAQGAPRPVRAGRSSPLDAMIRRLFGRRRRD